VRGSSPGKKHRNRVRRRSGKEFKQARTKSPKSRPKSVGGYFCRRAQLWKRHRRSERSKASGDKGLVNEGRETRGKRGLGRSQRRTVRSIMDLVSGKRGTKINRKPLIQERTHEGEVAAGQRPWVSNGIPITLSKKTVRKGRTEN